MSPFQGFLKKNIKSIGRYPMLMILSLRDITDMKKETLIKQHDIKDCGAACLASVSAHYGLKIPIAKLGKSAILIKEELMFSGWFKV